MSNYIWWSQVVTSSGWDSKFEHCWRDCFAVKFVTSFVDLTYSPFMMISQILKVNSDFNWFACDVDGKSFSSEYSCKQYIKSCCQKIIFYQLDRVYYYVNFWLVLVIFKTICCLSKKLHIKSKLCQQLFLMEIKFFIL